MLQSGPYRHVRHPFYASYLLGWFAAMIASSSFLPVLIAVVMTVLYVRHAKAEEALLSQSAFGEAYRSYRSRTGMLFPRLLPCARISRPDEPFVA